MLYCKNCGQQITGHDQFCPNCGQRLENAVVNNQFQSASPVIDAAPAYNGAQGYQNLQGYQNPQGYQNVQGYQDPQGYQAYQPVPSYQPAYQKPASAPRPNSGVGFAGLGSKMILFFVTVGVFLMNIIFMYCPNMSFDYYYGSESFSLFGAGLSDFDSSASFLIFVGILFLLGYLGSIVLCMLPIMTKKPWASKFFLCGRITCMAAVSVFLLFVLIFVAGAPSYWDLGMNFGGWMFVLHNIAGIVLSFLTPSMICKQNAAPQAPVYQQPQY